MLKIADTLYEWCRAARPFALATIVGVRGSAPLPIGTALALDAEGNAIGDCVEEAVHKLCRRVLVRKEPPARASFDCANSDASAVGRACGGEVDVLVQRVDPVAEPQLVAALGAVAAGRDVAVAVAHVVDGPGELVGRMLHVPGEGAAEGTLGERNMDRAVVARALGVLRAGRTERVEVGGEAGVAGVPGSGTGGRRLTVVVHARVSRPRMLIFGATDFTGTLSRAGSFLGYRVTVCDARPVSATVARSLHADEVVTDWPHRYLASTGVDPRTAVCVLTHDAKFDVPLLRLALALPVGYVGVMGSRGTHRRRLDLLREAGVPEDQVARLCVPIGLDLGALTPEETAVFITAEIIARANHGTARSLSWGSGLIHHAVGANGCQAAPEAVPHPERPTRTGPVEKIIDTMLGGVDGEPSHGPGHSRLGAEPAAGDNLANGVVATLAGRGVRTRAAAGTLAVLGAVGSPRCDGRTPEPEELVSSRTSEAAAEALGRWTTGLLPRTADQAVRAQAGRFDSQPNGHAKAEHDVAKLLSRAERRVARLVGLGQTNREIAGNLHITVSTVSQHLTRIYRKLGVQTRAELAKRVANIDPR